MMNKMKTSLSLLEPSTKVLRLVTTEIGLRMKDMLFFQTEELVSIALNHCDDGHSEMNNGEESRQHRHQETEQPDYLEQHYCEQLKQQAVALCMDEMAEHLEDFLKTNPHGAYEEWIEKIHPENSRRRSYHDNNGIDPRFYHQDSDHRKLWSFWKMEDSNILSRYV